MRLLFVTSGLARGGAEGFLARLTQRLVSRGHACAVASLGSGEPLSPVIAASGVAVTELGRGVGAAWRLALLARAFQPDVVQGWMYRGNLAARLAARACRVRPTLVWSVRQGLGDLRASPAGTRWVVERNARGSSRPGAIVYNAEDAARQHEAAGFLAEKTRVIPNGIDVAAYAAGEGTRARIRQALGIAPESLVVALFARWHPVKNHGGFARAAGIFARRRTSARFLMAGSGIEPDNATLTEWLDAAAIRDRCLLLGDRADVPDLLAASDVATLASHAEALPNALLEAMAAGVPCVAPALGDIAALLGDTGVLVPADDPEALAGGWERLAAMPEPERRSLGALARARVVERYGIDRAADAYEALYAELRR
jgi:glycosyltransferase involved in cell wall biosynthesis